MSAKKDQSRRNVAAMAREMATDAMEVLRKGMADPDLRVAIDAAKHVLDRAIGKPINMTADITDRIDDFTDEQLDAGIADLEARIEAARTVTAAETIKTVTH